MFNFFKRTTVASIMGSFTKTIEKLEAHAAAQDAKVAICNIKLSAEFTGYCDKIERLEATINKESESYRERAGQIANNRDGAEAEAIVARRTAAKLAKFVEAE